MGSVIVSGHCQHTASSSHQGPWVRADRHSCHRAHYGTGLEVSRPSSEIAALPRQCGGAAQIFLLPCFAAVVIVQGASSFLRTVTVCASYPGLSSFASQGIGQHGNLLFKFT